jgi:hypothetical protein
MYTSLLYYDCIRGYSTDNIDFRRVSIYLNFKYPFKTSDKFRGFILINDLNCSKNTMTIVVKIHGTIIVFSKQVILLI